jgi:Zn-dependent protease with chaperone function
VSESQASKQIDAFITGITNKIVLKRPLSTKGIIFIVLFLLVLLSSGYALATGIANSGIAKIICWVLLIFMSLNILSIMQSILLTIKYSTKKWNNATILKYFLISQKKKLSFFKVLLEVSEPDGKTFRTETKIMIKTADVAKLQEGKIISVKYFPDEKDNVVASIGNLMKNT